MGRDGGGMSHHYKTHSFVHLKQDKEVITPVDLSIPDALADRILEIVQLSMLKEELELEVLKTPKSPLDWGLAIKIINLRIWELSGKPDRRKMNR